MVELIFFQVKMKIPGHTVNDLRLGDVIVWKIVVLAEILTHLWWGEEVVEELFFAKIGFEMDPIHFTRREKAKEWVAIIVLKSTKILWL